MKSNNRVGADNISAVEVKVDGENLIECIQLLHNKHFKIKEVPVIW